MVAAIDTSLVIYNSFVQQQNDITLYLFGFGNSNKHFQSENNKIIMHSGHGFLAPYDQLTAGFNFMNRYDEPVEVTTTIIKQVGDQPTSQLLGDYFVAGNKTDYQPYVFHVSTEGENDIRLVITLKNSTSHLFIQNLTTPTIPLLVESVSSKLQEQANIITFSTLVVSGAIGGATVYALLRTRQTSEKHTNELREANRLLGKQNEMYQEQFKLQNRPWITFLEPMPVFAVGESNSIPYLDYAKNPTGYTEKIIGISFSIDVKNIGNLPSRKVTFRILETPTKPTRTDLITGGETGNALPLAPQEKIAFKFFVPAENWNTRHKVPYYFGLYVEYEIDHNTIDKIGKIWSVLTGGTGTEDSWIQDN